MAQDKKPVGVLITRPAAQSDQLFQAMAEVGVKGIKAPMIDIKPLSVSPEAIAQLKHAELFIFTSPNAVLHAPSVPLDKNIQVIAMGPTTAHALKEAGWPVTYTPPKGAVSENLLDAPILQGIEGKRCTIIAGAYGRDTIQNTLKTRGADVTVLKVYEQGCPKYSIHDTLPHWRQEVQVVVITATSALRHLVHNLGPLGTPWLTQTTILTVSPRLDAFVASLGFLPNRILSESALDEDIVNAILAWQG